MGQPMTDIAATMENDVALVDRLLRGDTSAASDFFARVRDTIWTACKQGSRDERAARTAYSFIRECLQADGFALLRPFRGNLQAFVRLIVREILINHILSLEDHAGDRSWLSFEALFKRQIMSRIATVCRDPIRQAEIYQRVSITLSKDDYRLLRSYSAAGKLAFSLRKIVRSAASDQHREEASRPSLPEAIEKLSKLDILVFKSVYWERLPENPDLLLSIIPAMVRKPGEIKITREKIEASLARVRAAVPTGYERPRMVDIGAEDGIDAHSTNGKADGDDTLEPAIEALCQAIETLSEQERFFVRVFLEGSHEQRRSQFGEDNYKLMRKVKSKLARLLADEPAIKDWLEDIRSLER